MMTKEMPMMLQAVDIPVPIMPVDKGGIVTLTEYDGKTIALHMTDYLLGQLRQHIDNHLKQKDNSARGLSLREQRKAAGL